MQYNRETVATEAAVEALRNRNGDVRATALGVLADMGSLQHVPILTLALSDAETGVREQAAKALAQVGGEAGIMALTAALINGKSEIAEAAAGALARIETSDAIDALINASKVRTEPSVQHQIAYALKTIVSEGRGDEHCRVALTHLAEQTKPKE